MRVPALSVAQHVCAPQCPCGAQEAVYADLARVLIGDLVRPAALFCSS